MVQFVVEDPKKTTEIFADFITKFEALATIIFYFTAY